jgi:hypothetical protein
MAVSDTGKAMEAQMNRTAQLLCAWSGPVLVVLFTIGFVLLAGFIPPPSPTDSPQEITAMYRENLTEIRIGMVLSILAVGLMFPWGAAIAAQTRRTEGGFPVLTYTQLVTVAISAGIFVLDILVWAVAAYRPGDISPETTRTLNDLAWFMFLFSVSPTIIWLVAVGLAVLFDRSNPPVFPRWAGYLSLWAAFLLLPADLILFFKTGPFAFNGLLALYVPFSAFFGWLVAMTVLLIKAINREEMPTPLEQVPSEGFPPSVGVGRGATREAPAPPAELR